MEKNKNAMMGLLVVSLCLGLLWGVSPSMAGSIGQAASNQYKNFGYSIRPDAAKTNMLRSFKTPAKQQRPVTGQPPVEYKILHGDAAGGKIIDAQEL